ncbi:aminopeptidase, partial [Romboutsia ilealis]|nr:aminopeptidase [Romboutsia ilealis]
IKKYQWLALPLALHGVVVRKDGTKTEVKIGEKEKDPVFVITDLLPHLGREQSEKKVKELIDAEKLDLLIGNLPCAKTELKKS